jgi:glyoxylate/hydroxypyruvate reductase A
MISSHPIKGVYLSSVVDLKAQYGEAFECVSDIIHLFAPHEIVDPSEIKFALSWKPADNAFEPYPNIEMVSSIAAGVDSTLRCPSLPADVIVTRVCDPDQAYMTAGFAVWQVIWYHRNMKQYLINESKHVWKWVERSPSRDFTVGVLGFGFMGKAVVKALVPLGYPVVAACRTKRNKHDYGCLTLLSGPDSIRKTAARSNILINLLPLTVETWSILDAALFSSMPRASVLIQIGRGEHLVEEDLLAALDNGQFSAATIDVFRNEPLPSDHPYWDDPRIMVTPHDASESSISTVVQQVATCVTDIAQGRVPKFAVDPDRGY